MSLPPSFRRALGVAWVLLAATAVSCAMETARESALPASHSLPLHVVEFSGNRYVLPVDLDSVRGVPLMVHGNSRMYVSVTHDVGERLAGHPVPKVEEYGYSPRGKGLVSVSGVRVGGERFPGRPDVPVFDFTEDGGDTLVQGMVGVPFLLEAKAAVDFTGDRLLIGVADRSEPERSLLVQGYRVVPIAIQPGGRVTMEVGFPQIGRALPITPSTVSSPLTLHLPLFQRTVEMAKSPSPDRSPSGTTPDEFTADSVAFEIAGVAMHAPASFEDFAEYGNVPDAEIESYGMLGFDWMKEHQAILDYANRRLYFKP